MIITQAEQAAFSMRMANMMSGWIFSMHDMYKHKQYAICRPYALHDQRLNKQWWILRKLTNKSLKRLSICCIQHQIEFKHENEGFSSMTMNLRLWVSAGLGLLNILKGGMTRQCDSFYSIFGNLLHSHFHFQVKHVRNRERNSEKKGNVHYCYSLTCFWSNGGSARFSWRWQFGGFWLRTVLMMDQKIDQGRRKDCTCKTRLTLHQEGTTWMEI